jgi:hypothetical protein
MIDLTDNRLTFTFPEIARQLRAHNRGAAQRSAG